MRLALYNYPRCTSIVFGNLHVSTDVDESASAFPLGLIVQRFLSKEEHGDDSSVTLDGRFNRLMSPVTDKRAGTYF